MDLVSWVRLGGIGAWRVTAGRVAKGQASFLGMVPLEELWAFTGEERTELRAEELQEQKHGAGERGAARWGLHLFLGQKNDPGESKHMVGMVGSRFLNLV